MSETQRAVPRYGMRHDAFPSTDSTHDGRGSQEEHGREEPHPVKERVRERELSRPNPGVVVNLHERKRCNGAAPVVNALLFAVYHFYFPGNVRGIFIAFAPAAWLVMVRKNWRIALVFHMMINLRGVYSVAGPWDEVACPAANFRLRRHP